MVKHQTSVWNYFKKAQLDGKRYGICNFCETKYVSHAGKMRKHLRKCLKCPDDIKEEFKEEHINKEPLVNFDHQQIKQDMLAYTNSKEEVDDYRYFITETDPNLPAESESAAYLNDADEPTEDEYDIFAKFITSEVKQIKSDELRRRVKKKILQILVDAYSEEEEGIITIE